MGGEEECLRLCQVALPFVAMGPAEQEGRERKTVCAMVLGCVRERDGQIQVFGWMDAGPPPALHLPNHR